MFARIIDVFMVFFRLGLSSFGGPIAHLGYFHDEFVVRRKWFDERGYADLVALCQFLPGPASSQVGIAIGLSRAGLGGAFAAWLGFTLPSAVILVSFGLGLANYSNHIDEAWLHGLKLAAVAVVAQALCLMGPKLCPDKARATIAIVGALAAACILSPFMQVFILVIAGAFGCWLLEKPQALPHSPFKTNVKRATSACFLMIFIILLLVLPIAAAYLPNQTLSLFDRFFRAGSLVFGGGHVVLPLLEAEVVRTGLVSRDLFMTGYGAAQAIPGPLFTFTAYLGAVSNVEPNGWLGALICLLAAFLPSFLLIVGVLPFWERLRTYDGFRLAMQGVNAAVVGLLLAAFYNPVWTSAIRTPLDFVAALVAFLMLFFWKLPSWSVVMICAVMGKALSLL